MSLPLINCASCVYKRLLGNRDITLGIFVSFKAVWGLLYWNFTSVLCHHYATQVIKQHVTKATVSWKHYIQHVSCLFVF